MTDDVQDELERLVSAVSASSGYKTVCRELVAGIGVRELQKRRNLKEAIKATKNKLHQVAGVYLASETHYGRWLAELRQAQATGDGAALRQACRRIMAAHSSTRERLPILGSFYSTTLAACAPVHSVLDLACGLNPLAIPWMPLPPDATYYACDIFTDMMDFIRGLLPIMNLSGEAWACDVLTNVPDQSVDVALLLKAIPCLEQVDKVAGLRLLDAVQARHVLVSFPVASLTGRSKGMVTNYEAGFNEMMRERNWAARRFEFATELAFLITK